MAVLVAAVGAFDLRLLGWAFRRTRFSELAHRHLPWAWAALGVQVLSGTLLFSSEAVKLYDNPAIRFKLLLVIIAGIQALIFQATTFRNISAWDERGDCPISAKVAGAISLLLWLSIVTAGRFIGFT